MKIHPLRNEELVALLVNMVEWELSDEIIVSSCHSFVVFEFSFDVAYLHKSACQNFQIPCDGHFEK